MKVYPNPVKTLATIDLSVETPGKASVYVRDINGRIIKTIFLTDQLLKGNQQFELFTAGFDSGTYIVELRTDNQITQQKIIVSK